MTDYQDKPKFPCNGCGKCCRKVSNSAETAWLDRGDSVCRNFDEVFNKCTIYATRPLVCRVESYYDKHLSDRYSWKEFIEININICRQL